MPIPIVSVATPTSAPPKELGETQTFTATATGHAFSIWQYRNKGERLETDWKNIGSPLPNNLGITVDGRYWRWKGDITLLRGGTWGGEPHLYEQKYSGNGISINDNTDFLGSELTKISGAKGNYFRCTLVNFGSPYVIGKGNLYQSVFPFTYTSGKFRLDSINQNWVDRVDAMLYRCEELDIMVTLELYDTWWCVKNHWTAWDMWWNPDNVSSPSNYTRTNTGLPQNQESNNNKFTAPARSNQTTNPLLIAQKLFIRAVCDIAKRHNNVLIEIQNESVEPTSWADFWKNYIIAQGVTAPITTMQDDWNLGTTGGNGEHAMVTSGYAFGDQSQQFWEYNTTGTSNLDDNWNLLQSFRNYGNKPINAVKIYSRWNRTTGGIGHIKAVDFMFLSFMGGAAGGAFHPGDGANAASLGTSTRALNAMRAAEWLNSKCDMSTMLPVSLSNSKWTGSRINQQAFASSGPNNIAIYVNTNNDFRFNTTSLGSNMTMRWAKVDGSGTSGSGTTTTSSSKLIHNPFGNIQAVLVMTKA